MSVGGEGLGGRQVAMRIESVSLEAALAVLWCVPALTKSRLNNPNHSKMFIRRISPTACLNRTPERFQIVTFPQWYHPYFYMNLYSAIILTAIILIFLGRY